MSFGIFLMSTAKVDTAYWQIALFAVIVGAGLGLSMQTIVIALQNAVDFKDLGIATSSNTFFRTLGGAFGTAIFGTIFSDRVVQNLQQNASQLASVDPGLIKSLTTNTEAISTLPAQAKTVVLEAFSSSFHTVFMAAFPVVALAFFFAIAMEEKQLQDSASHANARQDAAGESLG
jgi:flagellar biosynthesis protein FliR